MLQLTLQQRSAGGVRTYPVERNKPAAIEVIYSKKGQGPLVGIAPVVEEKRPSKVEKEWSFQDESLDRYSDAIDTNYEEPDS